MSLGHPTPDPVGPGQESVWDYPRPPALRPAGEHVTVSFAGVTVAETGGAYQVLETSHPPAYYLPPADVDLDLIHRVPGSSFCEWKGVAAYADVVVGDQRAPRAAWWYDGPSSRFAPIDGFLSFYPSLVECRVDGELVIPQPGEFYGGWITPKVAGPFKGIPGSRFW